MFAENKNYTLGRGRLYFDQFPVGTKTPQGERYFGNTPEMSAASESENLDHFDSDAGIRQKDFSVLLELNRTLTFTTDHISPDNLALFFLGSSGVLSQSAATGLSENFTVKRGRYYKLGRSTSRPEGIVKAVNVVVKDDATPTPNTITPTGNYTVDLDRGRIYILPDAVDIADNDVIEVEYDVQAATINRVVTAGNAEIYGSLRFEATNPAGERFDYTWPYVAVRPNGDFQLKGEEWQTLAFQVEVLKLDDNTESVYITNVD